MKQMHDEEKHMMQDLMSEAGFTPDAAKELLALRDRLEKEGNWSRIPALANQIMELSPGEEILGNMLRDAEAWERELGIHRYTLDLLVLLCCWGILRDRYEERKYPMEIFRDSFRDLGTKMKECRDVYGVIGIFVGAWHDRFLDISRFALGRLQFELVNYPLEKEYTDGERTVKKGDTVINVHIPSTGPLKKEDTDAAFALAESFYRGELFKEAGCAGKFPPERIPEGPAVFMMESWLLDPDLMELLPEGNMKEFVSRFSLIAWEKSEQFPEGWRIFGSEWKKMPEELPRHTKLQKAVADYLQKGGKLGCGHGIFIRIPQKPLPGRI